MKIIKKGMFFFSSLSLSFLSLLFVLCSAQTEVSNSTFQVGVILDLDSLVGRVGLTSLSLALDDFYSVNTNYSTKLQLHVRDSNGQVTDAAASALNLLKDVEVDAIIGPQKSSQAGFVIGLGDRAKVPIISFSATSPSLHPQTPYFVQAALDDAAQVGAISAVVQYFQWSQVVLIYEESDDGNGIIPYLSNAFQEVNTRILYRSIVTTAATDGFMLAELYKMKTMQTRVFVVHMSSSLASKFFLKVKEAGMMSEGYVWIVTNGVMDLLYSLDSEVLESMEGVLGVKPLIQRSRKLRSTSTRWKRKFFHDYPDVSQAELSLYGLWAYDTLWALAMAAERVQVREPSYLLNKTKVFNSTDLFTTKISQTGPELLDAMSKITFQGLGGEFRLVNGKLPPSSFQILNVVENREREVGIWTPSQGILRKRNVNVTSSSNKKLKSIVFPGDSTVVPKGWEIPVSGKKLRIAVPVESGFKEFVEVVKDPETNITKVSGSYIEMFDAVMAALPYAVPYEYIPFEKPDGSSAGSYDDLTYQVFLQNCDAAVGDITATSNRSKYVEFTLPFAAGGVTMTVPITYENPNSSGIFLKPLTKELWLTAIALFILTGVALWILEHRFNNAFRGSPAEHAGMIFYFSIMSLVYAQRERIVSNLARLVVVVWMFVVLILNSTYTASLSARLTIQQLQPSVTDVNEIIRKGDYVGFHKGSFIFDLLQELRIDKSKIKMFCRPEDIDEALSKGTENGGISALFAVKPYTDLFLSNYGGKYMTVGPTYATEGFAYVFQKGSPLVADVSQAVIELIDSGRLSEIEGRWLKKPKYIGQDSTVASTIVSLQSFKALFGITGGITATCLLVFLATYMYKNRDFIRRISNSSITFRSKVREICMHFDQRDPRSFRSGKVSSEGGGNTSPTLAVNPCFNTVVPTSPSLAVNPCFDTIVPISSEESSDANGDDNPNSEHVASGETRPAVHLVNITEV